MNSAPNFVPDWMSPPGDTIADVLAARGVSIEWLSIKTGVSVSLVQDLVKGNEQITATFAEKLAESLGGSPQFWLRRQERYQQSIARASLVQSSSDDVGWVRSLPIADMVRWGWIVRRESIEAQIKECLGFFGVPDVGTWASRNVGLLEQFAFRSSKAFESEPVAVSAWLRQAERLAERIPCQSWNRDLFRDSLQHIRALTRVRRPGQFLPRLRELCAKCGVAISVVRALKGCRASGATGFISEDKAIIVLSFRYMTDDQFWFTFFHEAGHILLHDASAIILESGEQQDLLEQEANEFAVNVLFPGQSRTTLGALPPERKAIRDFALECGIAPGIVVGQLQYLRRVKPSEFNTLKARYDWESID